MSHGIPLPYKGNALLLLNVISSLWHVTLKNAHVCSLHSDQLRTHVVQYGQITAIRRVLLKDGV